ncbi:MAG: YheU family protein, partial [Deltaproteobacteria bacterium]
MQIPWTSLSPEALRGLVEEFVTRDGTDYGVRERSLEERMSDVLRQVERGEVAIVFD